ncbi:hypothetical protein DK37_23380 [Halomonas sp. SUBG004]|nr:hypothetical protein DK37_23380 [Halomonas sp. SUBG004]
MGYFSFSFVFSKAAKGNIGINNTAEIVSKDITSRLKKAFMPNNPFSKKVIRKKTVFPTYMLEKKIIGMSVKKVDDNKKRKNSPKNIFQLLGERFQMFFSRFCLSSCEILMFSIFSIGYLCKGFNVNKLFNLFNNFFIKFQ